MCLNIQCDVFEKKIFKTKHSLILCAMCLSHTVPNIFFSAQRATGPALPTRSSRSPHICVRSGRGALGFRVPALFYASPVAAPEAGDALKAAASETPTTHEFVHI